MESIQDFEDMLELLEKHEARYLIIEDARILVEVKRLRAERRS